ncbi:unnamed protein product [Vitrella brassicaformis CCMP3155]|uniref:Dynein assembly factor 1, axonemal homolog n=2 Tax=Vitrella brassicaformis TaxID=1169539 RepID=A0A0G4G3L0_VITBC|nr:unnamed protein product [Vitrella brassicaformis CCMP3155]|eukprot:CEM22869.1 unnamed protein product [Vitrella brassicaformis CCMP3155]
MSSFLPDDADHPEEAQRPQDHSTVNGAAAAPAQHGTGHGSYRKSHSASLDVRKVLASAGARSLSTADLSYPMTPETLREVCRERGLYETPWLNEKLYLHFKGFQKIMNLDEYYEVRALYLEGNGIRKIENMEPLVNLKCLYLQQNNIHRIEGLDHCTELVALDLSHNQIRNIENLACLTSLENFKVAHNSLTSIKALEGLLECPSIVNVDVSHNYIDVVSEGGQALSFISTTTTTDPSMEEACLGLFGAMPKLLCLYFHGNPAVRKMTHYRKKLVAGLHKLRYLDDRPVKELERRACEAWLRGGIEAEREARRLYAKEQDEASCSMVADFREMQERHREKMKKALDRIDREAEAQAASRDEYERTGLLQSGWKVFEPDHHSRERSVLSESWDESTDTDMGAPSATPPVLTRPTTTATDEALSTAPPPPAPSPLPPTEETETAPAAADEPTAEEAEKEETNGTHHPSVEVPTRIVIEEEDLNEGNAGDETNRDAAAEEVSCPSPAPSPAPPLMDPHRAALVASMKSYLSQKKTSTDTHQQQQQQEEEAGQDTHKADERGERESDEKGEWCLTAAEVERRRRVPLPEVDSRPLEELD